MLVYILYILLLLYTYKLQMPTTIVVAGLLLVFTFFIIFLLFIFPFLQFVAVLLCAENSFWHISKSSSFISAFQQAFKSYIEIGQEAKVKFAVEALGQWPNIINEQKTYQFNLLKIILDYCLRMSKYVFFFLPITNPCFLAHLN
jgi:hypothetical protein